MCITTNKLGCVTRVNPGVMTFCSWHQVVTDQAEGIWGGGFYVRSWCIWPGLVISDLTTSLSLSSRRWLYKAPVMSPPCRQSGGASQCVLMHQNHINNILWCRILYTHAGSASLTPWGSNLRTSRQRLSLLYSCVGISISPSGGSRRGMRVGFISHA